MPAVPPTTTAVAALSPSASGVVGRSDGGRVADPREKLAGVEAPAVNGPERVGLSPPTPSSRTLSLVRCCSPSPRFSNVLAFLTPSAIVPDTAAAAAAATASLLISLRC